MLQLVDTNYTSVSCAVGFSLLFSSNASAAAGKSTFVNLLKQADEEWEVVPEPLARWCNVQQNSEGDHEVR